MAISSNEPIEQKREQLIETAEESKVLYKELTDDGTIELSDDELDQATGGDGEWLFLGHSYDDNATIGRP